ncbi:MAG: hypothetical protein J0L92_16020 [Deltaproteobacteria bacterium]|nr:hypothetical protein [Deltaproteobacteria bacterium]
MLLLPVEREGHVADTSEVADTAATTGTTLRSHDAAREALVASHGEDPPEVSESDLARWVASSRQAVRSLARADYDGARSALAQAEAVTDPALAELNREATRARQVLDMCLYLVRSLEETSQRRRAGLRVSTSRAARRADAHAASARGARDLGRGGSRARADAGCLLARRERADGLRRAPQRPRLRVATLRGGIDTPIPTSA